MKAEIESTNMIVELAMPDQKARVWKGKMEDGTPFIAYITLCQAAGTDDRKLEHALLGPHPEADESTWQLVRWRDAAIRRCRAAQQALTYHPLAG